MERRSEMRRLRNAREDLTGRNFYRWTVEAVVGKNTHGSLVFRCVCVCGEKRDWAGSTLRAGLTRSCGCDEATRAAEREKKTDQMKKVINGASNRKVAVGLPKLKCLEGDAK